MVKNEVMPESQETNQFENMQTELHKKGAVLTKAWADLFSYLTKYQAEIMVKENAVSVAEKEMDIRKQQLEELKPVAEAGSEELRKLQDDMLAKERLLNKSQSELSATEHMLRRVQSDLTSNMELLEKSRGELLEKQTDLIRYRGDLERLKSELTIKEEQISIKDNLLKKLQTQLMKENAELKEQLELERQALEAERKSLEAERRAHEFTKRSLSREKSKSSSSAVPTVIEIPDSPPTLDLSVEQGDFGLSNIISLAEAQSHHSQPMDQDIHTQTRLPTASNYSDYSSTSSTYSRSQAQWHVTRATPSKFTGNTSMTATVSSPSQSSDQTQWYVSPSNASATPSKFSINVSSAPPATSSPNRNFTQSDMTTASSDTFFPSNVTQEDSKVNVDASLLQADSEMQSLPQPSTPSSCTSDSNQGPVPISGPYASGSATSPGSGQEGGDGKGGCRVEVISPPRGVGRGVQICEHCSKTFCNTSNLKRHIRLHMLGEGHAQQQYKCKHCGKQFYRSDNLKGHIARVHRKLKASK